VRAPRLAKGRGRRTVLALGLLLGGAAHAQDPLPGFKGEAAKGKPTWKLLCSSCHGDKGLGNGPAAIALNPRPTSFADPKTAARLTPDWVWRITREGGLAHGKSALMVPWIATLTEEQLGDVTAYVLTLVPGAK
jgi:hypothetical protein